MVLFLKIAMSFGYGIITKAGGLDAVIVSTTHKGLKGSEDQSAHDPIWHNHYVSLGTCLFCGTNPDVIDITCQSPGNVVVNKDKAVLSNMPAKFKGTDALTGDPPTLNPGTNVDNVVSFKIDPKIVDDKLKVVYVTDIRMQTKS